MAVTVVRSVQVDGKDGEKPISYLEGLKNEVREGDDGAGDLDGQEGNDDDDDGHVVMDTVRVSEDGSLVALAEEIKEGIVVRVVQDEEVDDDDDDDVLDISPNGNTLASLAFTSQEVAVRFKNMYVYDNMFPVLPASTRKFKHLRKLKYFSNEVKVLPDEVGDLTELEQLYLKISPTGLVGLPPLGKLSRLRALELHQAPAPPSAATLTRDITQLHSLTRLSVCHFSISWVPAEIGSLKNLEELDLSFNKLRALPKEIVGLKALKTLIVASNKLVELPAQLSTLPNLSEIDVSHNRLTSLQSLGLESMASLRTLNAQFNKLQSTGRIPEWVCCMLEGNEKLETPCHVVQEESIAYGDEYLLDCEVFPSSGNSIVISADIVQPEPLCSSGKGNSSALKGGATLKSRRGWRKQDNQQYKARQDRLNSSRKHRPDDHSANGCEVDFVESNVEESSSIRNLLQSKEVKGVLCLSSSGDESVMDLQQPGLLDECTVDELEKDEYGGKNYKCVTLEQDLTSRKQTDEDSSYGELEEENEKLRVRTIVDAGNLKGRRKSGYLREVERRNLSEKNKCRKAISGDRSIQGVEEDSLVECEEGVAKDIESGSAANSIEVKEEVGFRRHGSATDRNPKPSKRRRSAQDFSEISYKYYSESFCGIHERLPDGFYDAGRDRPFCSLEVLEKEQPSLNSREVILVDRERDEELDEIALSAQQLLGRLRTFTDIHQRITILALFVSDCFGGSDKTQSVTNMRRAALGGTAGAPFVCSCSSNLNSPSANPFAESSIGSFPGTALPSVHGLCEDTVRHLKAQRGSNVLPIGSLRFGVCRHRAILLKYLCDRADPIIPCELLRGYLDYMPHAWNVVHLENKSSIVRLLVDGCRPLDIRQESDPEYFCRYIPLKRFKVPLVVNGDQENLGCEIPPPVLYEKVGQGASGATVHRCKFGVFTAAAKVRQLEGGTEGSSGKGPESSCLSELRIFCSLGEHPCIVSFYGHQFISKPDTRSQLIIYMEYIQGGSLEGVLQKLAQKGQTHMSPKLACQVARNVACGLGLLHSKGIVHRDVKSSNILIDLDSTEGPDGGPLVKLCDFDSAVPLGSSSAHTCYLAHRGVPPVDVCVGTPRWIAPEVLRAMYGRHSYGLEADIWSLGCFLAELLTLKIPYMGLSESEVHSRIQMGQRPPLPAELENLIAQPYTEKQCGHDETEILRVLVRLFYSCTEASPSQRPTVRKVFSILSEISGPAPAPVDLPFGEKDPDEAVNLQVSGPNILRLVVPENLEKALSLSQTYNAVVGARNAQNVKALVLPKQTSMILIVV